MSDAYDAVFDRLHQEADLHLPSRRCESEACDEYDGIHCYGDGCAVVRDPG